MASGTAPRYRIRAARPVGDNGRVPDPAEPPFTTSRHGLLPNGPVRGRPVSYPGPVKVSVCRALHDDWADLADYVEVPIWVRARFRPGHEASGIWDWLEGQDRLGELAGALRGLGLAHCAELLDQH
jgi:hypothetical protein